MALRATRFARSTAFPRNTCASFDNASLRVTEPGRDESTLARQFLSVFFFPPPSVRQLFLYLFIYFFVLISPRSVRERKKRLALSSSARFPPRRARRLCCNVSNASLFFEVSTAKPCPRNASTRVYRVPPRRANFSVQSSRHDLKARKTDSAQFPALTTVLCGERQDA